MKSWRIIHVHGGRARTVEVEEEGAVEGGKARRRWRDHWAGNYVSPCRNVARLRRQIKR